MSIPGKSDCYYIIEMLRSHLIDYSYVDPWADGLVSKLDDPPAWLLDFIGGRYQGTKIDALTESLNEEPVVEPPADMTKFHLGCLWLRYCRRELSWASFLKLAGEELDGAGGDWECETPYHFLNMHEDAYFSEESEVRTQTLYLAKHDLRPWIELAERKFAPFRDQDRSVKARPSDS